MRAFWAVLVGVLFLWSAAEHGAPLRAEPAGTTIQVRDVNGEAIEGVRVSVRSEKYSRPDFRTATLVAHGTSNSGGTLRLFGLDPDKAYTLVATAPDTKWNKYHDQLLADWSPKDTLVTLGTARVVKGVVRDPGGKPVPYARVRVSIDRWNSAAVADKDGGFEFLNAPPGTGSLLAEIDRKAGEPVRSNSISTPKDGAIANLEMPAIPADRQSFLIVRVITPGGRPVMHGDASFSGKRRSAAGFSSSTFSGSAVEGGAALTKEFSLPTKVSVVGARSEYGEPLPCGPGKGGRYEAGPREETLRLPAQLFVEGRVLGPDKKPLPGIRVQALPSSSVEGFGMMLGTMHGEGISNPDGSFRIGGLGELAYAVECVETLDWVGGRGKGKGGSKDVELAMRAAVAPTLTFQDEAGKPVARALVRILPPPRDRFSEPDEARKREADTDAKGQVRIRGLDPELEYLLTAYPPTGRSGLLNWEIRGWVPKDTALTFERGRSITGLVRDQDRKPVPGARVRWTPVGKATEKNPKPKPMQAVAGADGRFALEKLRPGRYRVLARRPAVERTGTGPAPADPDDASKPVLTEAGTQDLTLLVRMPDKISLRVWGWDKTAGKPTVLIAAVGDESTGPRSLTKKLDRDGVLVVKGLRWDVEYAIWMPDLKHGKYVYEPGVRPKDERVTTTMKDGKSISGKIDAPKGTKARKVWAVYPGFRVFGKMKAGGRFEIEGLPPGPWKLCGCGKLGKDLIEKEVEVEPDQEPVIMLEAK